MDSVLPYLLGFAMFATVAVLAIGVISFGVHGDFYLRHANHLMRARVILQGISVAILALMVYLAVA
ncbi:MAG TPA: twin transmembrane helix small protein [Rhodospirillales bacterium]|jgi:hypothetical protein|nr:MAG: hypothetical protein COC02_04460 [Rhodospirillaceae bacterium]PPR66227.1 MAG: hypothetical protein CFH02_01807 [Alphaproteobacteria bacterium MarineAlpha3_Bin1]PPR73688.1 MAG: hypothetical protein CFH03_00609 [Alphaproteobacteria bacterium MarineAlpha3_Bin2]HIM24202.1 twin transmembrane helix small protein [Rhodospirillales bacterium]